ncbi:MAG: MmcQ/YjbR family DNA-binding protein [Muribaculum sp.]|nr:MmcQ/YjbR family DNA-binding protein [Muribaculaceae bacterium]MCM1081071.1 MmcQ/YjbR family DNA-binding protein [Muribaculum sp.]
MDVEELREYVLSLPKVEENQPWAEPQYEMLITYKVGGKWFMLEDPDNKFIDVKCDPETIAEMQSRYEGAFPAWHMNKEHWLGIRLTSDVPNSIIKQVIKDGYELIVAKLPKKLRENLNL